MDRLDVKTKEHLHLDSFADLGRVLQAELRNPEQSSEHEESKRQDFFVEWQLTPAE